MIKAYKLIVLCLLFQISSVFLYAQNIILTAGTVCTDSTVSVPVRLQNIQNIFGLKIRLQYNKTMMNFTGHTLLNPALSNMMITDVTSAGKINMELSPDTQALNISDETVLLLHFSVFSINNTLLVWDTVYFGNQLGNGVPATHINGALVMPPLIILQPDDALVCEGIGNTAQFKMQAVGTMHTYQWQLSQNGGNTWTDLNNNTQYQGVNLPVLTLNAPNSSMHFYLYRCMLIGYCTLFTNEAVLNIQSNIISHPKDTLIAASGTAVFSAEGSGSAPAYLWEVSTDGGFTWSSNTLFPPVITPEITLVGVPQSWNNYKFRCIVSGQCSPPTTISNTATLLVGLNNTNEREPLSYSIFPNPASDYFSVNLNNCSARVSFALYDITGASIIEERILKIGENIFSNINLKPGIYFYRIRSSGHNIEVQGKIAFM